MSEWIEVTKRFRTWASIPLDERVTEDDIRRANREYASFVTDRQIAVLRNPQCVVALKKPDLRGKWMPCAKPVADGADRCATHGGPSAVKPAPDAPTRRELLDEIARLRQLVEE